MVDSLTETYKETRRQNVTEVLHERRRNENNPSDNLQSGTDFVDQLT